jgi:hypothetical protein
MEIAEYRIEKIETTLDRLVEAISQIAVVDERLISLFKRMERFEKRLDEQEDELREIKETVIVNSKLITSTERIFWIAVSAGASALVYFLR